MLKNAPHRVLFIFGDRLGGHFPGVVCIVPSVKVRYFGSFESSTLAPQRAEVEVTFEEIDM